MAAFFHPLAEVAKEGGVKAGGGEGVIDDLLEAIEVGGFATLEEIDEAGGEDVEVVRLFKKTVALADSGGFDGDVAEVFELADRFDDFFLGDANFGGAFFGVDFLPFPAGFSGCEEFAEEGFLFGVETVEEVFEVAGEGEFVGGVEGSGRFEEALEFEVGEESVDDEGADVVEAREFEGGDVELAGLVEEDAEDGAEGIGLRGVAIGEVGEGAEVIAAGEEFAVGPRAIPSGAADFLGVVFERFWEVVVVDGADVRLVDAHPEGDGGADDGDLAGHKGFLDFRAGLGS